MSPRGVLILLILAAVTVMGATFSVLELPRATRALGAVDIAFPDLHGDPDSVSRIVLTTGKGRFVFARGGDGRWMARDKHNYWVSTGRVREIVTQLADMRLVEPKTALPERFSWIGVEAPDKPSANSALVRLETIGGHVLAEIILGERVWRRIGPARNGTFIRAPDGERAWLASGGVDLPADLIGWLDEAVIDLETDEVASVTVTAAGEIGFSIARPSPVTGFHLLTTEGPKPVDTEAVLTLLGGLVKMTFEDVVPRVGAHFSNDAAKLVVTTFDGLVVTVVFLKSGKETWAEISASITETDRSHLEAVADRVAMIKRRVDGWRYRISEWRSARLATPLSKLMAEADQ